MPCDKIEYELSNLLNSLRKSDKMLNMLSILSIFHISLKKKSIKYEHSFKILHVLIIMYLLCGKSFSDISKYMILTLALLLKINACRLPVKQKLWA